MSITSSAASSAPPAAAPPVLAALLPIVAVVLIAFLVIGLALPVLPLHLHQDLRLGAFVVGLVAGAQFAAFLVSRLWSGLRQTDVTAVRRRHRAGRAPSSLKPHSQCEKKWWAGTGLNRRHQDFQSCALPTELPARTTVSDEREENSMRRVTPRR